MKEVVCECGSKNFEEGVLASTHTIFFYPGRSKRGRYKRKLICQACNECGKITLVAGGKADDEDFFPAK